MILVNKKLDFITVNQIRERTNYIGVLLSDESINKELVTGVILDARPFDVTKYSNLKVISRVGVGVDNIDLDECKRRNIKVYTTACGELRSAVSEFTIKQLLILMSCNNIRDSISNKIVGIIGAGSIGAAVGFRLKNFGCRIAYFDKKINNNTNSIICLEKYISELDIVCIHISGTDCVLDKQEIELLKDGCYVLNMARQGCVNMFELCSAMLNGKDLYFASDVDNPNLFSFPYNKELQKRVLITPHIASKTKAARMAMENMALDNLCEALNAK